MASATPYDHLEGQRLKVYIGPVGETFTAVNATPAGNWIELGETDGEQSIEHGGDLTFFYDNDHQGPVKSTRPEEMITIRFTVVGLTLENYARILDTSGDVSTDTSPNVKIIPLKRGAVPNRYAMMFKGSVMSPYGAYPAQYQIPICVFANGFTVTFSKTGRAMIEAEAVVIEDDAASSGEEMGTLVAQTS